MYLSLVGCPLWSGPLIATQNHTMAELPLTTAPQIQHHLPTDNQRPAKTKNIIFRLTLFVDAHDPICGCSAYISLYVLLSRQGIFETLSIET